MAEYWPRVVDSRLSRSLASLGGVLLDGSRASGKSETALAHAGSAIRLDTSPQVRQIAQVMPERVLQGAVPRVVDEWQLAPELWNVARAEIDRRQQSGQFIFTGSAAPADDVTRHSGAGRFGRLTLRPMSLQESRDSLNEVSFSGLFEGEKPSGFGGLTVPDYASLTVRGGWPALVTGKASDPNVYLGAYLDSIARAELPADLPKADPIRMQALLRAIARNTATEANQGKLAAEADLNPRTVRSYLDTLTRVFVLEEQPAWSPKLRSNVRKRVKPKWHFVDPSLAAQLLGCTADRLVNDLETFGFLFESLCVRDLRVYASVLDGTVFHYRDETGLEVDAIVQLRDGRWIAIEVKLGGERAIEQAARNLRVFAEKVDDIHRDQLCGLVILTAGEASYPRDDGTMVVSLGHLCA